MSDFRMEPFWSAPPEQCDVVIIGAGLIGTAIALHLAQRGVQVAVLERFQIASGASGRNDGQIILETADYYQRMKQVYGDRSAFGVLDLKRRGQMDLHTYLTDKSYPELAYHRAGSLTLAVNDQEARTIESAITEMAKDGFHTEHVNCDQIEAKIGTRAFTMGKWDPLDATVNPAELTRLFAAQARKAGARIVENCPVTQLDRQAVHHAYGKTECEIVILATNAYSSSLEPNLAKLIFPVRGQVMATEPSDLRFEPIGCITNFGYDYWHWTVDGRLILGGKRPTDEHVEVGTEEWVNPKVQAALDAFKAETYPQAEHLKVVKRWSGIMGFSADGLPLIGPLGGDPTLWVAAGFTGYGLGMSWSVGKAVADVLSGDQTPWADQLKIFNPGRFS
ncbi:MAG: FAD-binding oxidoreductase [Acidobacteria bacterium]|nr:FAD-binding oxidoreductase [Acidobacteriota bacterium]MCB9398996.1 FAD-binding oxidoreductase [Acidobacteriota bacterium]